MYKLEIIRNGIRETHKYLKEQSARRAAGQFKKQMGVFFIRLVDKWGTPEVLYNVNN